MKRYCILVFLSFFLSLSCWAQVNSLPKLKVGLKVTPTQFLFGEKAATVEVKFSKPYSLEWKAGVFGQDKFEGLMYYPSVDEELVVAYGYLTQLGVKRYLVLAEEKSYQAWFAKPAYGVAYLQLLGLYKQSSFGKRELETGPSSLDPRTVEAQAIQTIGLKGQIGFEFQFWKVFYSELYIGVGWRTRAIKRTIYDQYPNRQATYPQEATKKHAYFTPQAGINIGVQLPFKG